MTQTFIIVSAAGANREPAKGTREQRFWNEHAAFIDRLVDEGFIMMGGPLVDEGGAVLVVHADGEDEARETVRSDPWYEQGILKLESVKRWDIFIDRRSVSA